jgi:hypothetical protein
MYGFQKRSDRPQTQKLADGGEVTRLGFKSKAQQEREQAAQAGSGPVRGPGTGTSDSIKATVPEGTYIMPADSTQEIGPDQLSGMGFRPGMRQTTQAVPDLRLGFKSKAQREAEQPAAPRGPGLGFHPKGVPVNLSNGEYKISPEQVQAIGAQVLDQVKGATHKQVKEGDEQVATDALYFVDGGLVEDPKKRSLATSPTNTYPGNQAETTGNIYAKSNADMASATKGFVAGAFPNTSMAIQSSFDSVRDAQKVGGAGAAVGQGFRSAMTPVVGFADDVATGAKRLLDGPAQALKTFATGDATPIGQDVVAAPAKPTPAAPAIPGTPAAATASNPIDKPGTAAPAVASPAASAATAAQTTAAPSNNVTREGNSFSGQNIGAGFTINGQQPRTGGYVAPAEYGAAPASSGLGFQPASLRGGGSSPDVMGILQRESQIRQSMAGLQDQVAFNEGTGGSFRKTTNEEIVRDMLVNGNSRDRASALGFMAGNRDAAQRGTQTEQELALRQQDSAAKSVTSGLSNQAQVLELQKAQRQADLQARYEAAKTPEERSAISQQIRDLGGKEFPNRFTVVPGGQEIDPTTNQLVTRPARVINNQTGAFVDQPKAATSTPTMPADKSQRKAGMVYALADGRRVQWDGTGATEVN